MGWRFGFVIFFFLLAPSTVQAFSAEELARREAIFKEARLASVDADDRLPPCEGMDRFSEVALRHEPPAATCPLSRAFHDALVRADSRMRANCREMSRWLEDELRDPERCGSGLGGSKLEIAKARMWEFRKDGFSGMVEEEGGAIDDLLGGDTIAMEEGKGRGEFTRFECAMAVTMGMQFRQKQIVLFNKHYGFAETSLASPCGSDGPEEYFRFLQGEPSP